MARGFFKSCLIMGTRIWIGCSLIYGGCQYYKTAEENKEINKISLKELVTSPPEKTKWVELRGTPLKDSNVIEGKVEYLLFMDTETNIAIFVSIDNNSSLKKKYGQKVLLKGMAYPFDKPASFSIKNVPAGMRISNLVVKENDTPPGWFLSWGLMILGLMIFPPWEKVGEAGESK